MSALEKMRDVFETCTVMAGVEPDFECIYITKGAADALFDEVEAENAKLRTVNARLAELVEGMLDLLRLGLVSGEGISKKWCRDRWEHYRDRYRELGVEV